MGKVDLQALLGDALLVHKDGKMQMRSTNTLSGKTVGIYFSAHWCPPCRGFTPRLRDLYHKLLKQGKEFEIVFVSSDSTQQEFEAYFGEMPWAAVPFSNANARSAAGSAFGVTGIPALAIVGPNGEVLCRNARGAAAADPEGTRFPWQGAEEPSVGMPPLAIMALMLLAYYLFKWLTGN